LERSAITVVSMDTSPPHVGAHLHKVLSVATAAVTLALCSLVAPTPAAGATTTVKCSGWREAGSSAVYVRDCASSYRNGTHAALYSSLFVKNVGAANRGVYLTAALWDSMLGSNLYGRNSGGYVTILKGGRVVEFTEGKSVNAAQRGVLNAEAWVNVKGFTNGFGYVLAAGLAH
jgi:hypothetical protein